MMGGGKACIGKDLMSVALLQGKTGLRLLVGENSGTRNDEMIPQCCDALKRCIL